jgi:hypothetical protein
MTAVTEGTEAGDMLVEVVAEGRLQIQCLDNDIKVMEADLDEAKDTALSLRSLVTTVVIAIPLVIAIVYAVSMFLKVKCLACCANAWVWMLLIIVCLSAALHGILAFLFADICYEFDLHLATYYLPESPEFGGYENLNFLPPEAAKFCGPDGSLAFMTEQFDEQLDASIQMAIDVVAETCNDPEMEGFMDCSAVEILDACPLIPPDAPDPCAVDGAGNIPSYKSNVVKCAEDEEDDDDCGWRYWNDKLGEVPDDLDIRNVDLDSLGVTDIDSMPPVIVQCLVDKIDAEDCSVTVTYSREFGSAPRGVVGVITERTRDCVNAGGVYTSPFSAAPENDFTEDDVKQCYIETECAGACPFISFRVCATDCTNEEARQNSEDVVAGIDEGTTMIAKLRDLLEEHAMPLLRCSFVSEMFADLFIPFCVDAFGGFSLIGSANVISIISLIISFPIGILATKRLVKSPGVSPLTTYGGKIEDDGLGQGEVGNETADAGQPPAQNHPHVVETTQLM